VQYYKKTEALLKKIIGEEAFGFFHCPIEGGRAKDSKSCCFNPDRLLAAALVPLI
jgi:hypothetical protein